MQALKLAWLGTRTGDHDAMVAFLRDTLGLTPVHEETDFTVLDLPDGAHVEVFGPRSEYNQHFSHPVAGFLVDDLAAAAQDLRDAGIEIVGEPGGTSTAGWVHFRGPDGHLYELTRDPQQLGETQGDVPLVLNVGDAPALRHPHRATLIEFEREGVDWPDTGINVQVMQPGQPNCKYHSEPVQEDFLVLHGECIAIVDGEEKRLRQWDLFHCPAGVPHVFVGAGDGPSAVLMIGSRRRDEAFYPVDPVAAKYDASVERATGEPAEAYAEWRRVPREPTENPWPLG